MADVGFDIGRPELSIRSVSIACISLFSWIYRFYLSIRVVGVRKMKPEGIGMEITVTIEPSVITCVYAYVCIAMNFLSLGVCGAG